MDALYIADPKTTDDFEAMLMAFRDNAEMLLGANASKMVPFAVDYDIGWRIESFQNDAGFYRKYLYSSLNDRKVFFPSQSNTEPLASLVYLDWTCDPANFAFLQTGQEGINYIYDENGKPVFQTVPADKAEYGIYSPFNVDYTMLMNGMNHPASAMNLAAELVAYPGADPKHIEQAIDYTSHDAVYSDDHPLLGIIASEQGMGVPLSEKRDALLSAAVTAPTEQFDAVWDTGMKDYLDSGGQAIIDERTAAWEARYGDAVSVR